MSKETDKEFYKQFADGGQCNFIITEGRGGMSLFSLHMAYQMRELMGKKVILSNHELGIPYTKFTLDDFTDKG
jgi:hypothetical protein